MEKKLTAFEEAEGAIERAIFAIPETETKSLITALVTYYKEGGAFEDLREALVKAAEDTFEEAEEIFGRETKPETLAEKRILENASDYPKYFYVNDTGNFFRSICSEVYPAEFDKLPELDYEEGNALIVLERRGSKTVAYEKGAEIDTEFGIELIQSGEQSDWETVEVFAAVLATLSNIGKGG